jgi:hypothetical protein
VLIAAGYIPARRAMKIDAMAALRHNLIRQTLADLLQRQSGRRPENDSRRKQ